jgi:hypothetical protein
MFSSIGSTYCTCSTDALSHLAHVVGLDQNTQSAKLNQFFNTAGFHMPCTKLGTLIKNMALVCVYVVQLNGLSTDINIKDTTYSCQFYYEYDLTIFSVAVQLWILGF